MSERIYVYTYDTHVRACVEVLKGMIGCLLPIILAYRPSVIYTLYVCFATRVCLYMAKRPIYHIIFIFYDMVYIYYILHQRLLLVLRASSHTFCSLLVYARVDRTISFVRV